MMTYDTQICVGQGKDTEILHIKSEGSDMIPHDMLPILKHSCIIDDDIFSSEI